MAELVQGTWEDAQAMVGQVIAQVRGPDPVAAMDFRRQLEIMAFDCPLHTDEATAQAHGYRTVPSPVSMTRTWSLPSYWSPGEPRPGDVPMALMTAIARVPGVGDTILGTHVRSEHHEPLYPGDRVTATAILQSVTPKRTRVGDGAFLVIQTTFTNQHDVVLTVETATLFRFPRGQRP